MVLMLPRSLLTLTEGGSDMILVRSPQIPVQRDEGLVKFRRSSLPY